MKLTVILLAGLLVTSVMAAETSTYGQRIVASVLMAEARGEGEVGMSAVAEVIRNRASETSRTPLEVVLKRGEFSSLNHTTPERLYRKFYRMRIYAAALRLAKTCYNAPQQLPNRTRGATFYDHKRNHPSWLSAVRLVACIGNHNFYVPK